MAVTSRGLAVATSATVEQVAQEALLSAGSATSSVLSGYFAAVALHPGVLLSPLTILTAGVGAGVRAFDGRLRQPGAKAKRPRGFLPTDAIPDAAFVAVPTGLQAALVALAYDQEASLTRVLASAISLARKHGAVERHSLLERIKGVGAKAFSESWFAHPLTAVASASEGGMLTLADLSQVPEVDHRAEAEVCSDGSVLWHAPWAGATAVAARGGSRNEVIACVDTRGRFAILCYGVVDAGIAIDELGLKAPFAAQPVLRGVPRVSPGTFLAAPAPIEIRVDADGLPVAAIAKSAAAGSVSGLELTCSADGKRIDVKRY